MPESVFARLCDAVDALQRLGDRVEPLEVQLALTAIVERLDAIIDATVGLRRPAPDAAEALAHLTAALPQCPVCDTTDCTHWQLLTGEERHALD